MKAKTKKQITLTEVKEEAYLSIQDLRSGKLDVSTANAISKNLDVIIQTAKTQVDFLGKIPSNIKDKLDEKDIRATLDTFENCDHELDKTLKEIKENNKKPYQISK